MKRRLLILFIFIASLLMGGCLGTNSNSLPSNKYVAIQVDVMYAGTLVYGTYPYPGMAQLPVGFYPEMYPTNDSLKIMVGIINTRSSIVSLAVNGPVVMNINNLPSDIKLGLSIDGVDKNGTIEMSYNNTSIKLTSGSTWKSPIISTWNETNTIKYPPPNFATGVDNGTNYTYIIQYQETWTVENKGMFNKT